MPDFIPGIYNYCDRWCERCPLTARCRVFAMEEDMRARSDDENAAFWAAFDRELTPGVDSSRNESSGDEGKLDEEWSLDFAPDEDDPFERAVGNPLSRTAMDYADRLQDWLSQHDLQNGPRAGANAQTADRDDALDILQWYSLQIGVKLTRAMSGQLALDDEAGFATDSDLEEDIEDGEGWPEEEEVCDDDALERLSPDDAWTDETAEALRDAERTDRDGSAKVALIGIERSLGALTVLRREFPAEDATIRDLFRRLSQLRVEIDRSWPHARTFQRPGFDD